MPHDPIEKQRLYYAQIAASYDSAFTFDPEDEHFIACALLTGLASHYQLRTLLDVGCGTGRAIGYLSRSYPSLEILGVEPVKEMRDAAVAAGIAAAQILPGDATALPFPDAHFECCTAFGVLHHVPNPHRAIQEMFRVAGRAVFISDHNIYGMGSPVTRGLKQIFRDLHCRWLLRLLLTGGKGYHDTDWDGVFYPFSLIDHLDLIRSLARKIYIFPTRNPGLNIYRETSHLAVLALI
ncbi:MAG: class I SAM-dependent methyltransferase [Cyanobium sp.]|jgi:ubiquinone/menaquinone biosynthesis C-methylase UbiE